MNNSLRATSFTNNSQYHYSTGKHVFGGIQALN